LNIFAINQLPVRRINGLPVNSLSKMKLELAQAASAVLIASAVLFVVSVCLTDDGVLEYQLLDKVDGNAQVGLVFWCGLRDLNPGRQVGNLMS
jgi:hypothetical protein